jgi:hypothetical protein
VEGRVKAIFANIFDFGGEGLELVVIFEVNI